MSFHVKRPKAILVIPKTGDNIIVPYCHNVLSSTANSQHSIEKRLTSYFSYLPIFIIRKTQSLSWIVFNYLI